MRNSSASERGFSLIELMVVVAILTLVMGVVFAAIANVQKRYRTEEGRVDTMQNAREFVDQIGRKMNVMEQVMDVPIKLWVKYMPDTIDYLQRLVNLAPQRGRIVAWDHHAAVLLPAYLAIWYTLAYGRISAALRRGCAAAF